VTNYWETNMGFEIVIGERCVVDGEMRAAESMAAGAPAFDGDAAGQTNVRMPSYGVWERFARLTGLSSLFFDKHEGIMREHPGAFALTTVHFTTIQRARAEYAARHPDVDPSFGFGADERSEHLARLLWLEWWVAHALETCANPVIYNR